MIKMEDIKLVPNETQLDKFRDNAILFLAPLGVIYASAIIGLLQVEGHIISLNDFIPNSFQLGAMALYILNSVLDYLRKIKAS